MRIKVWHLWECRVCALWMWQFTCVFPRFHKCKLYVAVFPILVCVWQFTCVFTRVHKYKLYVTVYHILVCMWQFTCVFLVFTSTCSIVTVYHKTSLYVTVYLCFPRVHKYMFYRDSLRSSHLLRIPHGHNPHHHGKFRSWPWLK